MNKICEVCKKAPATVHLTDIKNNVKKELHMCEACASQKGINIKNSISIQSVQKIFQNSDENKILTGKSQKSASEIKCDKCQLSWEEYRETGRLGCANDYMVFAKGLAPLLEDVHASRGHHVGKTPGSAEVSEESRRRLEFQRQLREAVAKENYEEAAMLRDRLASLDKAGL